MIATGGNNMHYQWYPGHMTKAKRMMEENIKLIDLIIEVVDARIPLSSRNPDIDKLGQNKYRLIILNKVDLADAEATNNWSSYFKAKGYYVVKMDARERKGAASVNKAVQEVCKEKIERDRKRGILNRPVRAMVVGIPNVGKSTFINSYAGKACAKTGNKPGVTKGKQWIRLNKTTELLDTPGILWPKFEDQLVGFRLALIGAIKDFGAYLEPGAGILVHRERHFANAEYIVRNGVVVHNPIGSQLHQQVHLLVAHCGVCLVMDVFVVESVVSSILEQ